MLDKEILKKVKQWVVFADEDLQLAQVGLGLGQKSPNRLIAFHAQQCAEKYLKAFLVLKNVDFPYTHNISTLLELCSKFKNWSKELSEAKQLTAFAISSRYPGEDEEVTKEEAITAINTANNVKDVVRKVFQEEGVNF